MIFRNTSSSVQASMPNPQKGEAIERIKFYGSLFINLERDPLNSNT